METTLPTEIAPAGDQVQPDAAALRLAANIAAQHGAGPGAPASPENPADHTKRPGRPPTHGRYSKAAGSDGKNPVPLPGSDTLPAVEEQALAQPDVTIPPDLFGKVISEALTLGENFAAYKIGSVGKLAGLTAAEMEPHLTQTRLGESRKQLIGELSPLVLQEWGLDPRLSPSVAVGFLLGPVALAAVSAYFTLAKLATEKQAMEKAKGKNAAQP